MTHALVITSVGQIGQMAVLCSCSSTPLLTENSITLTELNDLAHEHIEAVEVGYGRQSAVRSEDELVDLTAEDMTYYSD